MILKLFDKRYGWRFIDKVVDVMTQKTVNSEQNRTVNIIDIELQGREGIKSLSFSTEDGISDVYLLNDEGKTIERIN